MESGKMSEENLNREERNNMRVLDEFVETMNKLKDHVSHLEQLKMACIRCVDQHSCKFAFDPYNFNTEPGIDCLAAK